MTTKFDVDWYITHWEIDKNRQLKKVHKEAIFSKYFDLASTP